jgi:NAD(P)-dependent dehydrogenase (short-subunit alcohol dehydrogenase family)
MINPMNLTGKQVLVAGAGSEIGQAVINMISQLGAEVVMVDSDERKLLEILNDLEGGINHYRCFDIYSHMEIELNIEQIVKDYGIFHGFVYCAGIGAVRPLSLTKYENMITLMNANCFSFVEMVRSLTKKNSFKKGGSIVAISSISSIRGLKSKLAYSSSKAALDASVRCIAAELGERGIRVNTILKGGVSSDNKKDYLKNLIDLNVNETIGKQILGEISPLELATLVAFLLGDAVRTITGTSLLLDGGYSL